MSFRIQCHHFLLLAGPGLPGSRCEVSLTLGVGPSSERHDRLRGFGPYPFAPASEDNAGEDKDVERVEYISGGKWCCVCGKSMRLRRH